MKMKKTSVSDRKIVAVLGMNKDGFYLRDGDGHIYVSSETKAPLKAGTHTLEELVEMDKNRVAVYEGDTVEITF